jgi:hypothetical protein
MPHFASVAIRALVTKFLRDSLTVGALGVPDLEARARAAGILGERQQISHAKVFKHAKKSLGIRSLRAGFGARSQWRWQLPRQSEGSITTDSGTARERRGPIPIDWVQGVACLDPDRPPNDVPRHRWRQFVDDCKNFLSSSEHWANRAAGLGSDAMALFGCAPSRPLDYLGSAGLLWAINSEGFLSCIETGHDQRSSAWLQAHLFPTERRSGQNHFALGQADELEAAHSL